MGILAVNSSLVLTLPVLQPLVPVFHRIKRCIVIMDLPSFEANIVLIFENGGYVAGGGYGHTAQHRRLVYCKSVRLWAIHSSLQAHLRTRPTHAAACTGVYGELLCSVH